MLDEHYDVIVVGGGLAGLTASLHLSIQQHKVLVIEKQSYPHHKVCGEYVSNEVVPYLESLGVSLLTDVKSVPITKLQLSDHAGMLLQTKLPLGGLGISRYAFDELLYKKVISAGANVVCDTVTNVSFKADNFEITTTSGTVFTSALAIGAYGKRGNLDKQMQRNFIQKKSAWLGVKAHYKYDNFPKDIVALHNFEGGYGGLSKTETGAVNFCYLVAYDSFKKQKDIKSFNANVVAKNPFLNTFLNNAEPIFDIPLSIAQISFHPKQAVENHMLMCGDTAGLIHPLCGNGMAMAIHAAKIASEHISDYLNTKNPNRLQLERNYSKQWQRTFKKRMWTGRQLQGLLLNHTGSKVAMQIVARSPLLLKAMIKRTHGKTIVC